MHLASADTTVAAPDRQQQTTLAAPFSRSGRGLHTGWRSTVTVHPAPAGHGIVFRRDGLAVPALWRHRVSQPLCTSLALPDGSLVRTVEHLMAALMAHGIDNALVDVEGAELPIFNGSATPWCEGIAASGRTVQPARRRAIRILRAVEHREGPKRLRIEPAGAPSLSVAIELSHFGPLAWTGPIDAATFDREVAPSRSFGRLHWALPAKLYGLFKRNPPLLRGANFGSTAVLIRGSVIGGMTVEDEPVRHRALDVIGDLAMAGAPLLGHVTAEHPGHDVNHAFLAKLMRDEGAWETVEL